LQSKNSEEIQGLCKNVDITPYGIYFYLKVYTINIVRNMFKYVSLVTGSLKV